MNFGVLLYVIYFSVKIAFCLCQIHLIQSNSREKKPWQQQKNRFGSKKMQHWNSRTFLLNVISSDFLFYFGKVHIIPLYDHFECTCIMAQLVKCFAMPAQWTYYRRFTLQFRMKHFRKGFLHCSLIIIPLKNVDFIMAFIKRPTVKFQSNNGQKKLAFHISTINHN